MMCSTVGARAP
ncbi:hypothetical protein ZEAMMB73_Zm00001d006506 [Zea mays]|uniref:Uncharacterized protein n=1 Tax=Zea mays TaxID=4577 RepID=A0A1D6EX87_MAIZE|nr:hypothetical protein ZEAMMB73_Zm00001d006506 [Zea mays]